MVETQRIYKRQGDSNYLSDNDVRSLTPLNSHINRQKIGVQVGLGLCPSSASNLLGDVTKPLYCFQEEHFANIINVNTAEPCLSDLRLPEFLVIQADLSAHSKVELHA